MEEPKPLTESAIRDIALAASFAFKETTAAVVRSEPAMDSAVTELVAVQATHACLTATAVLPLLGKAVLVSSSALTTHVQPISTVEPETCAIPSESNLITNSILDLFVKIAFINLLLFNNFTTFAFESFIAHTANFSSRCLQAFAVIGAVTFAGI